MSQDHDHSHADNEKRLLWAMLLTGGFMLAEVFGGIVSGSLALLADAGHMLTDSASLLLAWFAARLTHRPANAKQTYGYHRVQVLAAFVNGLLLIGIVIWIAIEAIQRFRSPVEVMSNTMLIIAVLGLAVNVIVFFLLHSGDSGNINIRGAVLHVIGDLLGSVAAIVAALVIMWTGWVTIDPLLSLLVAVLILRSAWKITAQSGHILLEGAPGDIDISRIERELPATLPGVQEIHHVHVWSLTPEKPVVTLHAALYADTDRVQILTSIKRLLHERFGVAHATIQIEAAGERCADELNSDRER